MTTLVYRDGVMAGSRGSVLGEYLLREDDRKVHRLRDGRLFGWVGDAALGERVFRCMNQPKNGIWGFAEVPREPDGCAIVVDLRGRIWVFESGELIRCLRTPFIARGSGKWIAYGALEQGATAVEAVKIAARYDGLTGRGVQVMRLERKRR